MLLLESYYCRQVTSHDQKLKPEVFLKRQLPWEAYKILSFGPVYWVVP